MLPERVLKNPDNHRRGKTIFVLGGTRSGKSAFAVRLAQETGEQVAYVATARIEESPGSDQRQNLVDAELAERIANHRHARPSHWVTYEAAEDPVATFAEAASEAEVVLVDSLDLVVASYLLDQGLVALDTPKPAGRHQALVEDQIKALVEAISICPRTVIVVSNEVGSGVVPAHASGRLFRDWAGLANQLMAEQADEVYLTVAGIPLPIKGSQTSKGVVMGAWAPDISFFEPPRRKPGEPG